MPRESAPAPPSARDRASGIVATATVLALLYFGRDVLVPITLAGILSLLIAPLVRVLRRLGLGQTSSVLGAVLALAVSFGAAATAIGVQVVGMTKSLPQYERTIRGKIEALDAMTVGRLTALRSRGLIDQNPALELVPRSQPATAGTAAPGTTATTTATTTTGAPASAARGAATVATAGAVQAPIPVEIREPQANSLQLLERVWGSIWVPLETAGIVIVVLVFVLLEHEAVRDRFIRIAGGTDIRATTLALNDAGERLSRFFVSQFLVNAGVGAAVAAGLAIVGLPHALLWGGLAGLLRFVPYIGVWIAALFATLLAAAVDAGWTPAIVTLSLFAAVELIAGQLVEPQLFGHTTGLSPLSVVVAAIFWSWLWGPTGLIVSTPLTLCLVVAGRHIKALSLLDVLLGDNQALTMPQRFYQRALSGDSEEIVAAARAYLKRNSFAAYCDVVLMPALALARLDVDMGTITAEQLAGVREVMVSVIAAIGGQGRRFRSRALRTSVLDESSVGRRLRSERERLAGPFQGPLRVPPGSVMLCVGLGSTADDLATELLVRILRDQKVDARHISIADINAPPPPGAMRESVAIVYLVSAFPSDEREQGATVAAAIREHFPDVCLVTVFLPGMLLQPGAATDSIPMADKAATSFGHAVQICLSMQKADGVSERPGELA